MTCEQFEQLLADAIGGELREADRPLFDAHLAACDACRREFDSLSDAVDRMHALPGPEPITLAGDADRSTIIDGPARAPRRPGWSARTALRYAASILIAFSAGYACHAGLMLSIPAPADHIAVHPDGEGGDARSARTLRHALASAHARDPARSDLAKCLVAMFPDPKTRQE